MQWHDWLLNKSKHTYSTQFTVIRQPMKTFASFTCGQNNFLPLQIGTFVPCLKFYADYKKNIYVTGNSPKYMCAISYGNRKRIDNVIEKIKMFQFLASQCNYVT